MRSAATDGFLLWFHWVATSEPVTKRQWFGLYRPLHHSANPRQRKMMPPQSRTIRRLAPSSAFRWGNPVRILHDAGAKCDAYIPAEACRDAMITPASTSA